MSNWIATAVAASTFDRLPSPRSGVTSVALPAGVASSADVPSSPRCSTLRWRGRRRRCRSPNVTTRPRNHSRAPHDSRIVGVGDEDVVGARAVEDLGLGVGDGVGGLEESRGARRRRWSTRGRRAPRCRPACESLPDDSCPVRRLRSPAAARSSSSESGRPMWLLRFPLFLKTRWRDARNSAATSLVVVLPALPVIATTRAPDRRRTSRATSCSARVVSSTRITTAAGRLVCVRRQVARRPPPHRAPRASASATKSWPSNRSPAIATKQSPAASVRESIDDPPDRRRPVARGPPRPPARSGDIGRGQRQRFHAL